MAPAPNCSTSDVCSRDDIKFVIEERSPRFIVRAVPQDPYSDLATKFPADLQFNLSAVLGNDNGEFDWGRTDFQTTGEGFSISEDSGMLTGKLLNLVGELKQPKQPIDLHKRLQVEKRYNARDGKYYHLLKESKPLEARTIILCFDGTSNHFSDKNTNVVKLVKLLRKDDPSRQAVYYQTGVGTYAPPGLITSVGLSVASAVDEAVAWYLYQHVIDGYKFLMQTYRAGDRIALFGFSRGAFTARALAGMLHSVGLLPAHNCEHVPFAYEVYKHAKENTKEKVHLPKWLRTEHPSPEEFKKTFCVPVVIDFVGVWDTVASVGALVTRELPYIEHNPSITVFRQALALDERRGNFIPSQWDHSKTDWQAQDVREVWFRGEHCDVGGGSAGVDITKDHPNSMLSNISLRWMVRQMEDCKTGILLDHTTLKEYRNDHIIEPLPAKNGGGAAPLDPLQESTKLDEIDVANETYDSIGRSPLWNFLEYFGLTHKALKAPSKYGPIARRFPNAKSGREIILKAKEGYPIYIHNSVVRYMESNNYLPRARWHEYGNACWPRIEDARPPELSLHNSPKPCQDRLNMFPARLTQVNRYKGGSRFGFFCVTVAGVSAATAIGGVLLWDAIDKRYGVKSRAKPVPCSGSHS